MITEAEFEAQKKNCSGTEIAAARPELLRRMWIVQSGLRAISPAGVPLDASFSARITDAGFEVIIESRSGTNRSGAIPRNPDYEHLFELILIRAAALDAALLGVWVVSDRTKHLPPDERRLLPSEISFPVSLSAVRNFRDLRVRISGMQGAIGRQPGASGPGNRNKRVLLTFSLDAPITEPDLLEAIIQGENPFTTAVLNTILPEGDNAAARGLDLAALQKILDRYNGATPRVRQAAGRRIERGPIGNLLKSAHGYRCQICTALKRDTVTFIKPGGRPYVEAHHVDPVASGAAGSLRAENVIVVCPTHHRELHYGAIAKIVDQGDAFDVVVELGSASIPKSDLISLIAAVGNSQGT